MERVKATFYIITFKNKIFFQFHKMRKQVKLFDLFYAFDVCISQVNTKAVRCVECVHSLLSFIRSPVPSLAQSFGRWRRVQTYCAFSSRARVFSDERINFENSVSVDVLYPTKYIGWDLRDLCFVYNECKMWCAQRACNPV